MLFYNLGSIQEVLPETLQTTESSGNHDPGCEGRGALHLELQRHASGVYQVFSHAHHGQVFTCADSVFSVLPSGI